MEDVPSAPAPVPPPPAAVPLKHSGLGIASFVISLAAGALMLGLFVLAGFVHIASQGALGAHRGTVAVIGLGVISMLLVHTVGAGLGIGGICQKDRKKLFAVLGLCFNGFVLAGTIALMIIGKIAKSGGH
jgi:hypothetical protein